MRYLNKLESITLDRWFKCLDGDYTHTRVDLKAGTEEEDFDAWCVIHDQYLDEFRDTEQTDEITEIRMRIAKLECDYVIDDDNYLRNEIRRLKNELFDIIKRASEGGLSREGLIIQLEKWIGFRLIYEDTSARKFYNVMKQFENELKAQTKA